MQIFLSWSGEISGKIANIFKGWLPMLIQSIEPYYSPSDIDKGTRWSSDIAKKLDDCDFGLLFITPQNINSSWLLFEAGALSKKLDHARVCPILFDLKKSDIKDPLGQFQLTTFDADDIFRLVKTIYDNERENKVEFNSIEKLYELLWPRLESSVKSISFDDIPPQIVSSKGNTDLLEDIHDILRSLQQNAITDQQNNRDLVLEFEQLTRENRKEMKYISDIITKQVEQALITSQNSSIKDIREIRHMLEKLFMDIQELSQRG